MPLPSTRDQALKAMTEHAFLAGAGYLRFVEKLRAGLGPANRCYPPNGTANRSMHFLVPPGAMPLQMAWVEQERAWARGGGIRMAFSAEYLSSHGWTYKGPAT